MSTSGSGSRGRARPRKKAFPVTVTHLPLVRCAVCGRTVAHRPGEGEASAVLTAHYEQAHPQG